jgi:hypothetical protein
VKTSEIVRIAIIAVLAIIVVKVVAMKTNIPGLRSVAGVI